MFALLFANQFILGQGYDDTGGADRTSIIIGALALPCLIIIAVVWQKLKNAKENEKHIEKLQKKVSELERTSPPKHVQTRYGLSLGDAQVKVSQLKPRMTQYVVRSLLGKPDEIFSGPFSTGPADRWDGAVWSYRWKTDTQPQKELTIVFEQDSDGCFLNNWYFE
ncbi:MAG TPA: hypothetical protein VGV18_03860 [Verrucomicrobiae bacterium]|nr:hypothetical protein [Verrucomicrobiae bacterium]